MQNKNSFIFWQRWLFYSSLLFALFGVIFAIYGNNPLFLPYNRGLASVFWNTYEIPKEVLPFQTFIWGPLGATIACCYVLLAYIAWYPFLKKEKWARNAIIAAFSVWVILDSFICIKFGVYFQIYIINLFSIITKSLPIIFTWKEFKESN
jgi:hypothetical protein